MRKKKVIWIMPRSKKDDILLVGKFEDAHVVIGDWVGKSVDQDNFKKPFHDVSYKGSTYRFINPDELNDDSIEALKQQQNSYNFGGDLKGMLIEITSGGIRSQHVPELMPE